MCGIAGIILVGPAVPPGPFAPRAALDAASIAIAHRGPDGSGLFERRVELAGRAATVALAHRRLTILDAAGGGQPMVRPVNADPREQVAVVFNGCIYNHPELRRDLTGAGSAFASDHSDTEVVAMGWLARRSAIVPDLDGMFAFAAWDGRSNVLTLARDRAGEKPVYFTTLAVGEATCFAFASTVPALVAIRRSLRPDLRVEVDPLRVRMWASMGFGAQPPLDGIEALPPGGIAELDLSSGSPRWAVSAWRTAKPRGSQSFRLDEPRAVLDAIDRSVRARLVADVPVGCFLSGGIDSPLIAAAAKRHAPDVRTFTVRMPDASYDESPRAAEIAKHLGTRHTTLGCDATPCADLESLIPQLGLPLGDSSLLPTAWVSRAAREHVTVALSGDGADELFDGYARYRGAAVLRSFRGLISLVPSVVGRGADPRSKRARLARLAEAARGWGYEDLLAIFPAKQWGLLAACAGPEGVNDPASLLDPSAADVRTYLAEDLLRKVDTASMAVALEVRAPFLAREIFEARSADPAPEHAGRKRLLREAAASVLPAGFAAGPKSGFAIPIGRWLRSNFAGLRTLWLARVMRPDAFGAFSGAVPIRQERVAALLAEHDAGVVDHGQRLYHLLVLAIWSDWVRSA
jgi:asparagine synthase (glutamine-hydrolysing)